MDLYEVVLKPLFIYYNCIIVKLCHILLLHMESHIHHLHLIPPYLCHQPRIEFCIINLHNNFSMSYILRSINLKNSWHITFAILLLRSAHSFHLQMLKSLLLRLFLGILCCNFFPRYLPRFKFR